MRKIKLVVLALVITLSTSAQWKKNFYVDDFGDKTNDYYYSMSSYGTFSNSATQNSKLLGVFIHAESESSLYIKVYEYERRLATHYEATFEDVKIKTPSGNVITIGRALFTKGGLLFFDKDRYKTLLETIKEKGTYKMAFNRTTRSISSSYKLTFTIQ